MADKNISTKIVHKRGVWSESVINRLKDGEVFYDITGEHGIYLGQADIKTGKVSPVKLAGVGGGGGLDPDLFVKKTDIITELTEETYASYKALSANAGKTLKSKITSVEESIASPEFIKGSNSVNVTMDSQNKRTINVKTDSSLSITEEGLGTSWVDYNN